MLASMPVAKVLAGGIDVVRIIVAGCLWTEWGAILLRVTRPLVYIFSCAERIVGRRGEKGMD